MTCYEDQPLFQTHLHTALGKTEFPELGVYKLRNQKKSKCNKQSRSLQSNLDSEAEAVRNALRAQKKGWVRWLTPVIPTVWEAEAGMVKPDSTKNTTISWVWWQPPVVPATQEAEAGESLEPKRRRPR